MQMTLIFGVIITILEFIQGNSNSNSDLEHEIDIWKTNIAEIVKLHNEARHELKLALARENVTTFLLEQTTAEKGNLSELFKAEIKRTDELHKNISICMQEVSELKNSNNETHIELKRVLTRENTTLVALKSIISDRNNITRLLYSELQHTKELLENETICIQEVSVLRNTDKENKIELERVLDRENNTLETLKSMISERNDITTRLNKLFHDKSKCMQELFELKENKIKIQDELKGVLMRENTTLLTIERITFEKENLTKQINADLKLKHEFFKNKTIIMQEVNTLKNLLNEAISSIQTESRKLEAAKISNSSELTRSHVNESANEIEKAITELIAAMGTLQHLGVDKIEPECTDNDFFANCAMVVRANHCLHKYLGKFCCRSCKLAGQLF